jgi:GTP diphosphokinase / guanosine-3',5'-bis(diphosphate) 3'-diphosphatase
MDKLSEAIEFAFEKHKGQLDDDNNPYYEHLSQVVSILEKTTNDNDILAAAWLHDVVEDCGVTYNELKEKFGKNIADLVMEVTHDDHGNKGYTFPRLKHKEAIMIKFADRLSNISRMSAWDDDRREHYLRRSKFWKKDLNDEIIKYQ